jgi:hypothetical protein
VKEGVKKPPTAVAGGERRSKWDQAAPDAVSAVAQASKSISAFGPLKK